jgi:pyrroloquinoline quinone (PQQ) biosynthesis protein C
MATAVQTSAGIDISARITAVRDQWHTKRHPLFKTLATGELDLRVLGIYMAQHAKYVRYGLEAFGLLYARGASDVRKMLVENMAEEEGLIGGHGEQGPHDHMEMIYEFCAAAGLTRDEVLDVEMTPGWWGRALYYLNTARCEPVGVVLAMQFTQEGQMPALIGEVVLPALDEHYGFAREAPEVVFFAEHEVADEDHSRRQLELAAKYLDTPELCRRAEEVAADMCRLRWGCTTYTLRMEHLGQPDDLPPGIG